MAAWINVTPSLKRAVDLINNLDASMFPLLNRITNSDDDTGNWSPPMPSVPPPPEALQELEFDGPSPELPPWPVQLQVESFQKSYGIALYDYSATHPHNLSFEERTLTKLCGTFTYMTPEVLMLPYHGEPADLWSCGIILVFLLTGG